MKKADVKALIYRHERRLGRSRLRAWFVAWRFARVWSRLPQSVQARWLHAAWVFDAIEDTDILTRSRNT